MNVTYTHTQSYIFLVIECILKVMFTQAMGLFLPQPPAPDSDEEEDPEGAAACRSDASIPMDPGNIPSDNLNQFQDPVVPFSVC